MKELVSFLTTVEPFQHLPAQDIARAVSLVQMQRHKKGDVLYSEGQEATHVWVLQTGRLEILKFNSDGRPLAIETIQPKDLFGTFCRMGIQSATYPCTAVAAMDSISLRLPDAVFNGLYQRSPAMATRMCELCSLRLNSMQKLAVSYQEPVRTRIVQTLFQLQKNNGDEIPYTKREISGMAATTVETTIRVLSVLQRKRWISSVRGKIWLKNIPQLQSLLSGRMPKLVDSNV